MSFLVLHWYWLLHCWVLSSHERHFTVLVHVTLKLGTNVKMEQKCAPLQWLLMGWLLVLSGICRYPHVLLCLMGTDSFGMLWARYTLSIPIYIMSVITEGITIHQSLPYFESLGTYSFQLSLPVSADIYFPILLKAYLPLLAVGACVTVWHSLRARELRLEKWNKKIKRKWGGFLILGYITLGVT